MRSQFKVTVDIVRDPGPAVTSRSFRGFTSWPLAFPLDGDARKAPPRIMSCLTLGKHVFR